VRAVTVIAMSAVHLAYPGVFLLLEQRRWESAITASDIACAGGAGNPIGSGCVSVARAFTVVLATNTGVFYINQDESSASSYYHSLQTSLRVNGWHGLTTAANFVWSHSIDTASDGADFVPNAAQPNNSTRPRFEKGNSNFDIRRRFTWNYVYQFPNRKGSWSKLTDGWGLDGGLNLQDGQPFHLNVNFVDDFSGSGQFFDRPDVVGPIRINSHDPANFLDLTSLAIPCTLSGATAVANCQAGTRHFGNMGRDSWRGPSLKQVDFSVFKNTKLGERVTMQLRAEVFNILNHPNFSNPLLPSGIADAGFNGSSNGTPGFCGGTAVVAIGRSCGFLPITTTADVGPGNPFLGGRRAARDSARGQVYVLTGPRFLAVGRRLSAGPPKRQHSPPVAEADGAEVSWWSVLEALGLLRLADESGPSLRGDAFGDKYAFKGRPSVLLTHGRSCFNAGMGTSVLFSDSTVFPY